MWAPKRTQKLENYRQPNYVNVSCIFPNFIINERFFCVFGLCELIEFPHHFATDLPQFHQMLDLADDE